MAMEDSFSFRDILVDLDLQNIEGRWREKREKERMKKNEKKRSVPTIYLITRGLRPVMLRPVMVIRRFKLRDGSRSEDE